jgi:hypothetical protein
VFGPKVVDRIDTYFMCSEHISCSVGNSTPKHAGGDAVYDSVNLDILEEEDDIINNGRRKM